MTGSEQNKKLNERIDKIFEDVMYRENLVVQKMKFVNFCYNYIYFSLFLLLKMESSLDILKTTYYTKNENSIPKIDYLIMILVILVNIIKI